MDPVNALRTMKGSSRWKELRRAGVARSALLEAVRAGVVLHPGYGVYCLPGQADSPQTRALLTSGALTCVEGAQAHGLETFEPTSQVHVRVVDGPRTRRQRGGVVLHPWGRAYRSGLATLHEVVHDCLVCLPPPQGLAVLESALRQGRIEVSEIPAVVRSGPHPYRAAVVAALVDPRSGSVLETVARVLLLLAGAVDIRSQVWIERVGRVDLLVAGWLIIELDGWSTHRSEFQEDRRRDAELARWGLRSVRFTYWDLRHRPEWVVAVVLETLERGRPPFAWLP